MTQIYKRVWTVCAQYWHAIGCRAGLETSLMAQPGHTSRLTMKLGGSIQSLTSLQHLTLAPQRLWALTIA